MATDVASPVKDLVRKSSIIVVLGPGGVGKTTSSVSLALIAARMGKRVGLLSIDPAKRLADAMGIKLGHELSRVTLPPEFSGTLDACMLDQAAVFDHMVERFASPKTAQKIFNNSVYRQASRNLGGPLEYMALAKLTELIDSNTFDIIVLDTPPDTHALDFLVRPSNLSGFVERGVMKWLIKPFHLAQRMGFSKLLSMGEKLMGGVAAVTGVKLLEKLSDFLVLMDDVIKGFHDSGIKVTKALRVPTTNFVLLTAPNQASQRSARKIARELHDQNFSLGLLVINRMLPAKVRASLASEVPGKSKAALGLLKLSKFAQGVVDELKRDQMTRWGKQIPSVEVEETYELMHSLEGVIHFADRLAAGK